MMELVFITLWLALVGVLPIIIVGFLVLEAIELIINLMNKKDKR